MSLLQGQPLGPTLARPNTGVAHQFAPTSGELVGAAPLVKEPYGYGSSEGRIDVNQARGQDLWRQQP